MNLTQRAPKLETLAWDLNIRSAGPTQAPAWARAIVRVSIERNIRSVKSKSWHEGTVWDLLKKNLNSCISLQDCGKIMSELPRGQRQKFAKKLYDAQRIHAQRTKNQISTRTWLDNYWMRKNLQVLRAASPLQKTGAGDLRYVVEINKDKKVTSCSAETYAGNYSRSCCWYIKNHIVEISMPRNYMLSYAGCGSPLLASPAVGFGPIYKISKSRGLSFKVEQISKN